jgi:hypothetical protein
MKNPIRLACLECDTQEGDGIREIPATWKEVIEIQSLEAALAEVPADDKQRSIMEWYTHLGLCPACQKGGD